VPVTPTLDGPRLRLRRIATADVSALLAIRAEPDVLRWWGEPRPGDFAVPDDEGDLLVIEVDGAAAGAIQYFEEPDPMYRHAVIDIYLGAEWAGRGLGREAMSVLAQYLIEERSHHRLTVDPAAANERAIRCYEAVGFARVGVLHRYERRDDGTWHDGLLMELVTAP
jgi:aminoglycoside 6'-N-acetyltransferase